MSSHYWLCIRVLRSELSAGYKGDDGYPKTFLSMEFNGMSKGMKLSHTVIQDSWAATASNSKKQHFCCEINENRKISVKMQLYQDNSGVETKTKLLAELTEIFSVDDLGQKEDIRLSKGGWSIELRIEDKHVRNHIWKPRIFALIIGIDKYSSSKIPNLCGCVHDATDIQDLLQTELHIPNSHIRTLFNQDATRHNIIASIESHLTENGNIHHGDPIIIFFAGHGNRVSPPKDWPSASNGKIEVICPHDEWLENGKGGHIHGIPDYEINKLIRSLSNVKGNNITLILDSCHSGGIARDLDSSEYTPRSFSNPCPIETLSIDSASLGDNTRGAGHAIPAGFIHSYMTSNVLFAACGPNQKAHEFKGQECAESRGLFTVALVERLRNLIVHNDNNVSYSELINSLPELRATVTQTPQCEGDHKYSTIFTVNPPIHSNSLFPLKITKVDNAITYEVRLGASNGVVDNTVFRIHYFDDQKMECTGRLLKPFKVLSNSTILMPFSEGENPLLDVPKGSSISVFILQWSSSAAGNLNVYADFLLELGGDFGPTDTDFPALPSNFCIVEKESEAHISISEDAKTQQFIIKSHPSFYSALGFSSQDIPVIPLASANASWLHILNGITKFRYHLTRRSSVKDAPLEKVNKGGQGNISIELHLHHLHSYGFYMKPDYEVKFNGEGVALIPTENLEDSSYGFEVVNNYGMDLFVYLFWFDPSDYSIQDWYHPHSADDVLKDKEVLTIGYGAGGGDPFQFSLEVGEQESTGFVKLFLFKQFVNLDNIPQQSLTGLPVNGRPGQRGAHRLMNVYLSMVAKIHFGSQTPDFGDASYDGMVIGADLPTSPLSTF